MALIVVRAAFQLSRAQRQHGLGTIQCLNLAFLIHTEDQSVIRQIQIQTHDVPDFFNQQRVGRELKLSVRCSCKPNARQIRLIVIRLSPVALANSRVLQCVWPRGVVSSV